MATRRRPDFGSAWTVLVERTPLSRSSWAEFGSWPGCFNRSTRNLSLAADTGEGAWAEIDGPQAASTARTGGGGGAGLEDQGDFIRGWKDRGDAIRANGIGLGGDGAVEGGLKAEAAWAGGAGADRGDSSEISGEPARIGGF